MTLDAAAPIHRDCTQCGAKLAMRLLEIYAERIESVPLRYVCSTCGATLIVPPRVHTR